MKLSSGLPAAVVRTKLTVIVMISLLVTDVVP